MTTEAKIKEAFDQHISDLIEMHADDPDMLNVIKYERQHGLAMFASGYMALLNELVPEMALTDSGWSDHRVETLYRLPEGVTKP